MIREGERYRGRSGEILWVVGRESTVLKNIKMAMQLSLAQSHALQCRHEINENTIDINFTASNNTEKKLQLEATEEIRRLEEIPEGQILARRE